MKKLFALLLVMTMIGFTPAYAATTNTSAVASPQYEQICEVDNGLTPNGRTLNIYAATLGYSDATKCGVTATLQKLSGSTWTTYKTWSATSPSSHPDYVEIDTSISVSAGEYRMLTSHSVTVGTYTEYESMASDNVYVS